MRLLKLNSAYRSYLNYFYTKNPGYSNLSYSAQKKAYFDDGFSWGDAWTYFLAPFGYDVDEIVINEEIMQRQWALEEGIKDWQSIELTHIVLRQIKSFKPDILWFDVVDQKLIELIVENYPDIKFKIGWVGSAVHGREVWSCFDLVLTCAPETRELMSGWGVNIAHLNHAFDPRVINGLHESKDTHELAFIGQILKGSDFHLKREEMLKQLSERVKLTIFSPGFGESKRWLQEFCQTFVKRAFYNIYHCAKSLGKGPILEQKFAIFNKISKWEAKPEYIDKRIDQRLRKVMRDGVYGLDMLQVIRDSKVVLNIHADSSPKYASNMRLFEVTGVGGCLLTDWKQNIGELFEPDYEVVTYKNLDECLEKARWLLDNESERKKIAEAGKKRVLREHTFEKRAGELDNLLKNGLKGKS